MAHFSGASLERPALQQLLADIRAGNVEIVVVYKVDRLTRSLADFAKLIELFDAHGVSFVSVTQSFNTSSSMGRLTLNVLLSFAQFERELIGERVRDKIAASKRKGIWVGGPIPLGYAAMEKKIAVVPAEAEVVRMIFAQYSCVMEALRNHLNPSEAGEQLSESDFELVERHLERVTLAPKHLELRLRPGVDSAQIENNASTPSITGGRTITVPWARSVPAGVKGIIHVPAHSTPARNEL
jgi:hypothetical protein